MKNEGFFLVLRLCFGFCFWGVLEGGMTVFRVRLGRFLFGVGVMLAESMA